MVTNLQNIAHSFVSWYSFVNIFLELVLELFSVHFPGTHEHVWLCSYACTLYSATGPSVCLPLVNLNKDLSFSLINNGFDQ